MVKRHHVKRLMLQVLAVWGLLIIFEGQVHPEGQKDSGDHDPKRSSLAVPAPVRPPNPAIFESPEVISCIITSDPSGADIYAGESYNDLEYIGVTPKTLIFTAPTGYAPYWKAGYYKFTKKGYENPPVIYKEKGAFNNDRNVHIKLVPMVRDSPYEPVKAPTQPTSQAIGTGFVVSEDGLILTAHHLLNDAASITLHFPDGRSLQAKIVKASQDIDLAVLKVNENTPNFLELARVGSAQVGDHVFTLGYPAVSILGTEPKFTDGVISAKSGPGGEAILLQISVPVQPGNSGGPLVNEKGEVVGIITSGAAIRPFLEETGTLPQNVNWAVNADFAQPLYRQPAPKKARPTKRSDIITKVRKAICLIQAIKHP